MTLIRILRQTVSGNSADLLLDGRSQAEQANGAVATSPLEKIAPHFIKTIGETMSYLKPLPMVER
jgi:hypothetical protein